MKKYEEFDDDKKMNKTGTQQVLDEWKKNTGEGEDVLKVAAHQTNVLRQKYKMMKWVTIIVIVAAFVLLGLMIAGVVIGNVITKDVKVTSETNILVTNDNKNEPIKVNLALFPVNLTTTMSTNILNNVVYVIVEYTKNESKIQQKMIVEGYELTYAKTLIIYSNVYYLKIDTTNRFQYIEFDVISSLKNKRDDATDSLIEITSIVGYSRESEINKRASNVAKISTCKEFYDAAAKELFFVANAYVITSSFSCSAELSYNLTRIGAIFTGSIDGGYNTITLNFEMDFSDYVKNPEYPSTTTSFIYGGLFPILSGGSVKNLVIKGSATFKNIGPQHQFTFFSVGGLFGSVMDGGNVTNCISYLKLKLINCTNNNMKGYIGGLFGSTIPSYVFNSFGTTNANFYLQNSASFNKNNVIQLGAAQFGEFYLGGIFGKASFGCYNSPSFVLSSILNSAFFNVTGATANIFKLGVFSSSLSFSASCAPINATYDIFSTAGFGGITPSNYYGFAFNDGSYKSCSSVSMQNNAVMSSTSASYGSNSYCPKNLVTTFSGKSPLWCQTNSNDLGTLGLRLKTGGTCFVSE